MQGLGDVAHEVDEELQRLSGISSTQPAIGNTCRVVGEGRDGASRAATVTAVVDIAGRGRVVFSINEVKRGRPGAGSRGAIVIGPGCDIRQVRGRGVTKNALRPVRLAFYVRAQAQSPRQKWLMGILTRMPCRH